MVRVILIIICMALVFLAKPTIAVYDPSSVPNNKYGMHIADFNDIRDVASLVNSSGGDWGYVTLVLTDSDHDKGKIQGIFDTMRRIHLIPLVRIATHVEGSAWVRPNDDSFHDLVSFLNSLNWPVENKYVILYNEPNHANEWGGTLNPEEYATVVVNLARKFKQASDDFFILPAGLDVSAASDGRSMNASEYLERMIKAQPDFLHVIDGWTSHSYPNPGFSGSPYASGRGTLRSYQWEMQTLRAAGFSKKLPIFITETGWVHNEGKQPNYSLLSTETVAKNLIIAANDVWSDDSVVAITPFVFNYQDVPFDTFSFKKLGAEEFYPQYEAYKQLPKIAGRPNQNEVYILQDSLFPTTLVAESSYSLTTTIINKGQGIFNQNDGYDFVLEDSKNEIEYLIDPIATIEPEGSQEVTVHIKTPSKPGIHRIKLILVKGTLRIPIDIADVVIVPLPTLSLTVQLGWKQISSSKDVSVLVYDGNTILNKFTGLSIENGTIITGGMHNIIPGRQYRVVVLVPSYLPRQMHATLTDTQTQLTLKRFYPFDLNKDGALSAGDFWKLFQVRPLSVFRLFVGI